jgi:hypothetical protein
MFQHLYVIKKEELELAGDVLQLPTGMDLRVRNVERGSRIVGVVRDGLVVMALPRGNLESIVPKIFSL